MAWSSICRTLTQILSYSGKDKLTSSTLTERNNISAVLYVLTLTNFIAPPVIFALSSLVRYLEDDFQRILKNVLDFRLPTLLLALALAPQQYKHPCERPLKAQFPDVYWDKTHLKCYNLF